MSKAATEADVQFWVGIATFLILTKIQEQEKQIMALADTLAELQAEDTELAADVTALVTAITSESAQITDLQAQIAALTAAGSATPEQLAALQTVADDLAATHATAAAAVPAAP